MKKLSGALLLLTLAVPLTATAAVRLKRLPEGVELHGDVVKLKAGYVFKRVSSNKVLSEKKGAPGGKGINTHGSFSCNCTKEGGSCAARIDEGTQSLSCSHESDCDSCDLVIDVEAPGKLEVKPKQ